MVVMVRCEMRSSSSPSLMLFLLLVLPLSYAQLNAPFVYWYNHPVQPNETVMVFGAGLSNAIVNLCDNSVCDHSSSSHLTLLCSPPSYQLQN